MIDRLLGLIAPHICCSCGVKNAILCQSCRFDIIDEPFLQCVECLQPTPGSNICSGCRAGLRAQMCWVVSQRTGGLKKLIDLYKFDHVHEAADRLAELLDARIAELPLDTIVTYVPDIANHRRQRGHDHMQLVATRFAARRGLQVVPLLSRATQRSQRGLKRVDRLKNQQDAFRVDASPDPETPVLLIDDIYTTGATLRAGVDALQAAGSATVYAAIIARQPLDHSHDL